MKTGKWRLGLLCIIILTTALGCRTPRRLADKDLPAKVPVLSPGQTEDEAHPKPEPSAPATGMERTDTSSELPPSTEKEASAKAETGTQEVPGEHARIEPATFNPDEARELMSLIDESPLKDDVVSALKDAHGNWQSLAEAIRSVDESQRDDLLWLISKGMSHLDRLEAQAPTILEHVDYTHRARALWGEYEVEAEMFRDSVLKGRIGPYEHITPWRKLLFDEFSKLVDGRKPDEIARSVNAWAETNLSIKGFESYFSGAPSPLSIFASRGGDECDISVLTVAILRSVGIPSRLAHNGDWVEFHSAGSWTPLYPKDSSNFGAVKKDEAVERHYKEPGRLELRFTHKGLPYLSEDGISLSVWGEGFWIPLDRLNLPVTYETKDDHILVSLPEGKYLVTAGIRNKNGDPYFYAEEVEAKSGESIAVSAALDLPPEMLSQDDLLVRRLDVLPDFSFPDREGKTFRLSEMIGRSHTLLVFFNLENEPSKRMLPLVQKCLDSGGKHGVSFVGVFLGKGDGELARFLGQNSITFPVLVDEAGDAGARFGLPRELETGGFTNLPSILLIQKDGEVLYWEEGYNLNIDCVIRELIELWLR